ncbi:FRAS1-related extracellular matrix protein 2-like [Tropilaelaps mercedesae]|uniref:FRAS1-related extracellular matrix protein 2-like n=1 Tax=Tropilaelaps mercedesae TaxID=418985 RepID=A0A1V9XH99_9ACAR|nr:FRAS1-related extracellular matrix protein 2-like [Tropilaelaps mercedesae]
MDAASNKVENITMNVYWCWLKLSAPSDVSAGETLTLELHRSGIKHTLTEGVLETPVGELPFSILPNVLTKFVPLHVPESLAGQRFSVRLSAVQGCLLHSICPSDQTVSIIVLSSRKDVHFENDAVNVPEPQTPYSKETFFVRVKRKPSPRRMDLKFRFYTIDGTARANEDFVPVDEVVTLKAKDDDISVPVEILGDNQLEAVEFFHIFIEPLSEHVQFRSSKARVDIEDSPSRLAFHSRPLVFAVDPGTGELLPHSKLLQKGTILYCATECDPHHPQYSCSGETLNSSVIRYEWKSLVQTTEENQKSFFSRSFSAIKSRSYLTRTNRKILPGFLYLPEVPHHDGAISLWSTKPISPGDYQRALFATKHVCSNIFQANASEFLTALDLHSCTWHYKRLFSLNELLACGAQLYYGDGRGEHEEDFLHVSSSTITISLPVHVMYVSNAVAGRWQHITVTSVLHVAFIYSNLAVGTGSVVQLKDAPMSGISGTADIDSIGVDSRENLVVNFQTSINFRGRLVAEKSEERWNESLLILSPRDGVQGAFVLRLEKQLSTAKVSWSLRSLAKLSRYSGNYSLAFYPCVGTSNEKCEVKPELAPLQFVLPVELETVQGTKQPLYPIVSFMELTLADRWLQTEIQDDHASIQVGPNDTFNKGEKVFGVVRSVLNGSSAKIFPLLTRIRQCFLCYSTARSTGASRPTEAKNQVLSCPHKIIDCEASKHPTDLSTMERSLRGSLASQNRQSFLPEIMERLDSLGADAFTFDTDSLFVWKSNGEDLSWHVHCIFAVAKEHDAGKGRPQRNIAPPNGLGDIILQKSLALHLGDLNPVAPQESDDGYPSLATAYSNVVAVFFGAALILVLGAAILNARQKKHVASSIYRTVPLAEQCFTLPVNTWDYQRETLL